MAKETVGQYFFSDPSWVGFFWSSGFVRSVVGVTSVVNKEDNAVDGFFSLCSLKCEDGCDWDF